MALTSTGTGTGSENDVVVSYGLVRLQKSNEAAGDSSTHFPNQMIRENASKQSQQGVSLNSIFGSAHTGESSNTPGTQTVVRTKHILIPVLTYDDVLRAFYVAITSLSKEDQMTVTACFKKELGLSPKDTKASSQKTNTNTNIRDSTISNQTHLMNTVTVSECNSRQSGECRASDENMTDCDVDASENYVTDEIGLEKEDQNTVVRRLKKEPGLSRKDKRLRNRKANSNFSDSSLTQIVTVKEDNILQSEKGDTQYFRLEDGSLDDSCHSNLNKRNNVRKFHTGEKPYQCQECKKIFFNAGQLIAHKVVHTGDMPFVCKVCTKRFPRAGSLKKHEARHTGVGYQCKVCEKSFSDPGCLQRHEKIHFGKNVYQCEFCGKKLTRADRLNIHRMSHTGERPYQCENCGERFYEKSQLKIHRRLHTGENPYQCGVCNKKCSRGGDLKRHVERHKDERPTQCDICKRSFSQWSHLNLHNYRVHKEEYFIT